MMFLDLFFKGLISTGDEGDLSLSFRVSFVFVLKALSSEVYLKREMRRIRSCAL